MVPPVDRTPHDRASGGDAAHGAGRVDRRLRARRDRELVALAREAAFGIVDSDPELSDHPVLRDELELLFTEEDEGFLAKS